MKNAESDSKRWLEQEIDSISLPDIPMVCPAEFLHTLTEKKDAIEAIRMAQKVLDFITVKV